MRKALRKDHPQTAELKKIKWLFLKNARDLTPQEEQQLQGIWLIKECGVLKNIYEAKNKFQAILEEKITVAQAKIKLDEWVGQAKALAIESLDKFVEMFCRWQNYILNYFKHRLSTGIIEGINNKIKLIKRRAFGFASFTNFRRVVIIEFLKT